MVPCKQHLGNHALLQFPGFDAIFFCHSPQFHHLSGGSVKIRDQINQDDFIIFPMPVGIYAIFQQISVFPVLVSRKDSRTEFQQTAGIHIADTVFLQYFCRSVIQSPQNHKFQYLVPYLPSQFGHIHLQKILIQVISVIPAEIKFHNIAHDSVMVFRPELFTFQNIAEYAYPLWYIFMVF